MKRNDIGSKLFRQIDWYAKHARPLRGRQILWMIYDDLTHDDGQQPIYDMLALTKIHSSLSTEKEIWEFCHRWHWIIGELTAPPDTGILVKHRESLFKKSNHRYLKKVWDSYVAPQ